MADTAEDTTTGTPPAEGSFIEEDTSEGPPTRTDPPIKVITDDPEITGLPEGEEMITGGSEEGPPSQEPAAEPEAAPAAEGGSGTPASLVGRLEDLSRKEIERLHSAVESVMRGKGSEPQKEGPSMSEIASALPLNQKATADWSAAKAAAAFKKHRVKPEDVLTFGIRQKVDPEGNPVGPAYLRVVTRGGKKLTAKHG